jgi:hypothetical protein
MSIIAAGFSFSAISVYFLGRIASKGLILKGFNGGDERDRTDGLLNAIPSSEGLASA